MANLPLALELKAVMTPEIKYGIPLEEGEEEACNITIIINIFQSAEGQDEIIHS